MSNNPSLSVEFKAINESPVIQSIDRVSRAGQTYMDKWKEDARTSSGAYVNFWKTALREVEKETSAGLSRMSKAISDARQKQLSMESRISLGGGYGPNLPSAPAQSSSDFLTKINAGMVNAAAMATLVGKAYQVVASASRVIASFVEDAAKWEQIQMGLNNIEGSATAGAKALEHLYVIAKAPGIDLETASQAYLKLRSVKIEGTEAERVIKAFSNTVARGGGGSVQFQRVLEQLTQMMAGGKVLQADLKFMKNSMPELASLMQKAFGTTTAEGIRNMNVNSQEFLEGILKQMELLPKAHQTLRSEMENTGVAWSRLKAAFVDTDYVKSKLVALTKVFEGLQTAIAGSSHDKAVAEINAKYDNQIAGLSKFGNSPARWLASKMPGVSSALDDEAYRGQLAGELEKQRRADLAALEKGREAPKSLDETLGEFDPNNPFKVRGSKSASDSEKKKKYDPAAADQERLRQMLRSQAEETAIRDKYNDTVAKLTQEGVDESEAKAVADRDKAVDEVRRKFNDMRKLAHGNAALENQITNESERQQYETFVLWNDKLIALREENEKKKLEQKRKYQEEEDKANKAHQDRVDAWNQKQIDKNREKNQKANEYEGSKNPLVQAELTYWSEAEKITELFTNEEDKRTKYLEQANQDRLASIRQFYADQYSIALTGSADMFMALAELRKNGTSEANDAYQVLFGISKAFAIADATVKLASAAISAMSAPDSITTEQKFANMGSVMAAGAGLISQINSTAYSGVFDRGGNIRAGQWGIAGENGPEIIQGPAHVTSTRDTARLMGSGSGEAKIVVNNYAGATVSTTKNNDGTLEILIQRAAEAAEDRIASGIASGGGKVSQQMTRTFGVKR